MPEYNIVLNIAPEKMHCANCSRSIREHLKNFLTQKNYPYETIMTDYRKKG